MLLINKDSEHYSVIIKTFDFIDHFISMPFLGLENAMNIRSYNALKSKLNIGSEDKNSKFSINISDLINVCGFIDLVSKIFLTPKVSEVREFLSEYMRISELDVSDSIDLYLKMSTKFFNDYKRVYENDKSMLEKLEKLTAWRTKL